MNTEDIIRMAREAGLSKIIYNEQNGCATLQTMFHPENIEHFANLVAAAWREACAKVCDERAAAHPMGSDEQCEAEDCAAAIRARGQG
jgi:hypothetical protein